LNGSSGYTFTATARDGGAAAGVDTFSLEIYAPGGTRCYQVSGTLAGGDIAVK
jgi:hypothetical protein